MLRGRFTVTNGMEWSDAGDVMYVTDTTEHVVYRAPYGPGDEPLGELEPFLVGRNSDGLTRDTAGCFWNGIYGDGEVAQWGADGRPRSGVPIPAPHVRSEEHTSELQSLMRISYAVFCLKKKIQNIIVIGRITQ